MTEKQKEQVIKTIKNNARFDDVEITEETSFSDLGMDDLDVITVVMEIEDEFGLFLECSDIFEEIKTVGDLFKKFEEAE
jgi:acyl carrier protein